MLRANSEYGMSRAMASRIQSWNAKVPGVAGHDRRLAAHAQRADQPARVDGGDFLVVAVVLGPAGDVFDRAVGVVGVDRELLPVLPRHDPVFGDDGDLGDGRVGLL